MSTYIPPLSEDSYRVAVPCSSGSHPPWPAGICTKCQPSAVTLTRQSYRMVDHVEFAHPDLINNLLGFWRKTATQRFGYLLGSYAPYEKVPMGVKAVVEAIHEPPQEPHKDGITVGFPWDEEAKVEALAAACGLQIVGVIFTDLEQDASSDEAKRAGKVVAKRHANSFFLSSLEVLFSATLQRRHRTPSRFSMTGHFSSRFVTCVLSGDVEGQIAVEAYQVSDQAMAMVDADMVEASVDPGVVRVKEEGPTRYIPDVFYRYKNKYGLEVKESAKPCFPVEYLLVNVRKNPPPPFTCCPCPPSYTYTVQGADYIRACTAHRSRTVSPSRQTRSSRPRPRSRTRTAPASRTNPCPPSRRPSRRSRKTSLPSCCPATSASTARRPTRRRRSMSSCRTKGCKRLRGGCRTGTCCGS